MQNDAEHKHGMEDESGRDTKAVQRGANGSKAQKCLPLDRDAEDEETPLDGRGVVTGPPPPPPPPDDGRGFFADAWGVPVLEIIFA